MSKLMPFFGKALLMIFAIGVFVIVASLSYRALGLIFPDDLFDQAIGLLLFDASALIWFVVFVYQSESTMQYVFAGFGFLIGLVGTIALVSIEVGISSGTMQAAVMLKPLTYVFIGVAVAHLVLLYARHAAGPQVSADISLGVEKAKIQSEGMRQAEQQLQQAAAQMGSVIRADLVNQVLRDLNMSQGVSGEGYLPMVIDSSAQDVKASAKKAPAFNAPFMFRWPWLQNVLNRQSPTTNANAAIVASASIPGETVGDSTATAHTDKQPIESEKKQSLPHYHPDDLGGV
jgi:hypothetical protein